MTSTTMAGQSALASLPHTLDEFRACGQMDMAFGGVVNPAGSSFSITHLCGARTASLSGVVVRSGAGLGGKALSLGRPVSVQRYTEAKGITHHYDSVVGPEQLETVAALPVLVDSTPRLVVYVGKRAEVTLGDRWFDAFNPLLRRLKGEVAIEDEVRRRLALMRSESQHAPALSDDDRTDIARDLEAVAASVTDPGLRARLELIGQRIDPLQRLDACGARLSRREIDVVALVAHGQTNQEVADNLGLLPNTVKSYLQAAMRKLEARNRLQAVTAARRAGLIP